MQYRIPENVSSLDLCAQIESGLIAPDLMDISLEIFLTAGGTAESKRSSIYSMNAVNK